MAETTGTAETAEQTSLSEVFWENLREQADLGPNIDEGWLHDVLIEAHARIVAAAKAQTWDDALEHVWELSDPIYTISDAPGADMTPVNTAADLRQAMQENPYRTTRPASEEPDRG